MHNKPLCTGCNGEGFIYVSVQKILKTLGRICVDQIEECPICHGTKVTTQDEVDYYFINLLVTQKG